MLKLVIQAIDVPNSDYRYYHPEQAYRAEAEPRIKARVKPSHKNTNNACGKIIGQDASTIKIPYLSERSSRTQHNGGINCRGVNYEIHRGENEEET